MLEDLVGLVELVERDVLEPLEGRELVGDDIFGHSDCPCWLSTSSAKCSSHGLHCSSATQLRGRR